MKLQASEAQELKILQSPNDLRSENRIPFRHLWVIPKNPGQCRGFSLLDGNNADQISIWLHRAP